MYIVFFIDILILDEKFVDGSLLTCYQIQKERRYSAKRENETDFFSDL